MDKMVKRGVLFVVLSITFALLGFYLSSFIKPAKSSYFLIFILSAASSATILFPAPVWFFFLGLARTFDPITLSLTVGLGSALGEFSGYFLGRGIRVLGHVEERIDRRGLEHLVQRMKESAALWLFILSFIPNPVADLGGIAAGLIRLSPSNFFFPVFFGKFLRFLILFYIGHQVF